MDFRKATDALFMRVGHEDLAKALSVSVALIRQARLGSSAEAHRSPPEDWKKAVLSLAETQELHYRRLAKRLRDELNN